MRKVLHVPVFTQTMIWSLVITTLVMGWYPPEGMAMVAPALSTATESVSVPNRVTDLRKVQSVLESKVVRQRLEDFGLTPGEINARLARLSDDQLHQLATQIDALTPGGNGLGIIIALLVIAILVVILVYLFGHRITITKQGEEK
ncbi:MAG: PA2779 family protein [Nitrospiraceae bacterium]